MGTTQFFSAALVARVRHLGASLGFSSGFDYAAGHGRGCSKSALAAWTVGFTFPLVWMLRGSLQRVHVPQLDLCRGVDDLNITPNECTNAAAQCSTRASATDRSAQEGGQGSQAA